MPLSLRDLQDEATRLKSIIEHAQQELDALQVLIKGRQLRDDPEPIVVSLIQNLSVEKAVVAIHRQLSDQWLTGTDMASEMIRRDPSKNTKSLRANIGNAHRKLLAEGVLERKNRGTENQPEYLYRWKDPMNGEN